MYTSYSHTTKEENDELIDWYGLYNSSGPNAALINYVSFSNSPPQIAFALPFDEPMDIIEAGAAIQRSFGAMIGDYGTRLNHNIYPKEHHEKLLNAPHPFLLRRNP